MHKTTIGGKSTMYRDDSGLLIGNNTPTSLLLAEVAHLNPNFNHKCKSSNGEAESIKLMAQQIVDEITVQSATKHSQQSVFNFTNNGIYAAQKGIYHNVVQIDTHSQLPTFMYYLGLMDDKYQQLYLRKKQIEKLSDYKTNSKLAKERQAIKFKLNMYCSTNDSGKGRYVNRLIATYSSMNFMFEAMTYWGLSDILNCVNDGYIKQIKDDEDFDDEFQRFERHWQDHFPLLTFSKKRWKYAIIKSTQEYILINNDHDYKCRNDNFSVSALYYKLTGNSLRKLNDSEIDQEALQLAKRKEQEAIEIIYNNLFQRQEPGFTGSYYKLDDLHEATRILSDAGIPEIEFLTTKQHYYEFSIDTANSDQSNDCINQFTKRVLDNQLFISNEKLTNRINLLKQIIRVKEVNPDDYAQADKVVIINNFVPALIDSIERGQSIEKWIAYEIENIKKSSEDKLYQYNLLALTAQLYANEHKQNPNAITRLINNLRTSNELKKLDMGEIIANDPRTLIVDGQLMVKNDKNVFTSKPTVINKLLKEHFNQRQKQHFVAEKNNVLALIEDEKYKDKLDNGFMTPHQSVLLDSKGTINVDSPFKYRLSHYVNTDYNPAIVDDTAYSQVNSFLKHLAPRQFKQLKAMLGLIPLQETGIMKELRTFFVLKGVSGAGKSTLAQLLKNIFDENDQVESNIISSTQNVNKAFTDEHYIDLNDTKKGKIMLWFDDFQSSSNRNVITAAAGTVVNGALTGVSQAGAAKYEKEHPVRLPSLIVIATNAMPQISQEGTANRMFVIDCPKALNENSIRDENNKPVSINDFLHNTKVKEALFYIIISEASKILKMTGKERAKLFNHKYSAATKVTQLSDTFETFLEKKNITSVYDLVGMQAIKLFDVYKSVIDSYNVSYRSFNEQLERLGLVLKRKHFKGRNYQKVICAKNDKLTQAKINTMFNDFQVTPDCVEKWDGLAQSVRGSLKTWHHGYDKLKAKYTNCTDVFKVFDFSN